MKQPLISPVTPFAPSLMATAVIHGSHVSALGGLNLTRISWEGVKRYLEERTVPTCSARLMVNIDQLSKSIARYIFRMEKRKGTDQETIELMRQYFSGGKGSEQAVPVVASPQRKQVSSASSKAASDACSSRAAGDQLNLLQ
jgi:hypothetical protein